MCQVLLLSGFRLGKTLLAQHFLRPRSGVLQELVRVRTWNQKAEAPDISVPYVAQKRAKTLLSTNVLGMFAKSMNACDGVSCS